MSAAERDDDVVLGKAYDTRLVRRLATYVRPYRGLVLASLATLFASSGVQLVQPYLVKLGIDGSIRRGTMAGLGAVAAWYLLSLVADFALRFAQLYLLERTGQNVVLDLRMHVFSHMERLPAAYFDRTPVGRLVTRVTTDVEALNEAFTSGLVLILADLVKLAGIVAILLWLDWRMALVTFAIVPPMAILSRFFRDRIRAAYREVRRMVARLNAFLQESVAGMRLVQLFVRERETLEEFRALNRTHRDADLRSVVYDSAFSAVTELVGSIAVAAIVWAGGWRILSGAMTFGTLVAFLQYANRFFQPVQELSQRYAVMQAAMASSERIFRLLDASPEGGERRAAARIEARPRGEIAFEGVTFAYRPGEPVLRDVSFRVAAGERVALVGWTGSGKSTVVRLLTRLYEVDEGRITLDGRDVRDIDLHDLRRTVGVVLQDPFLFAGSVARNIALDDPDVDDRRVRAAARAVGADRFIERLPRGWDDEIRERGSNLSVGEKQLLSFARALAFDPPVLVLDEATSSIDPETERRIQEALRTLLHGRTAIVIAHRLSTVRDCDRILVLHRGRLREQGTHDELVRLEGGVYRTLHALQT